MGSRLHYTKTTIYLRDSLKKNAYASFFYDTACKTNLQILDRIQCAAARTTLGTLTCTKVDNLEFTANLLPLTNYGKMQMSCCKAIKITSYTQTALFLGRRVDVGPGGTASP